MTAATSRRHAAAVRLVTGRALSMALVRACAFSGVTRSAARFPQLRAVRQAGVAALAGLMSGERLGLGQLRRMTSLASAPVGHVAQKVVGGVATLAVNARMKLLVGGRVLVARAAVAHPRANLRAGRVRIVTAHARAHLTLLGMIGVLIGVATRASLVGAAENVVRSVTVRALAMADRVTRGEHGDVVVAGAAGHRALFAETMRLMTADTGNVAALE
jgi:hypothetical protein